MALIKPTTTEESQKAAAVAQEQTAKEMVEEATAKIDAPVKKVVEEAVAPAKEAVAKVDVAETEEPAAAAPATIAESNASAPATSNAHNTLSVPEAGPSIEDTLKAAGFEGLILDGLSFDRIKLNNGQFLLGQTDEPIGTVFSGVIEKSLPLYLFRRSEDQEETEVLYSYDPEGKTTTSGADTSATFAEWAGDGFDTPVKSQYMECVVTVTECPAKEELAGEMVICQIAPASVRRISGHFSRAAMKHSQVPSQYITKFAVGAPITKGRNSYNPWVFNYAGNAEDALI